jgi:large subunit ribosomal protein L30
MALKIKVIRSIAGASKSQLATLAGLGVSKFGEEKTLKDSPAVRGMVFKVKHLLSQEVIAGEAKTRKRRKPRKIAVRDRARAAAAKQAKA